MKQLSTRVKLRNAYNLLKKDQERERELIERIIQDTKGKDVSLDQILGKLKEKEAEVKENLKMLRRVSFQIQKQNEPTKNDFRPLESRNSDPSRKTGNTKSTEGLSKKPSAKN